MTLLETLSNLELAKSTKTLLADGIPYIYGSLFYIHKPYIYRMVFGFALQINGDDVIYSESEATAKGNSSGHYSVNPYIPLFEDLYKRLTE